MHVVLFNAASISSKVRTAASNVPALGEMRWTLDNRVLAVPDTTTRILHVILQLILSVFYLSKQDWTCDVFT